MSVETITSAILNKMPNVGKWQASFFLIMVKLLPCMRGRINYLNLARYGFLNELTMRRNFSKFFDFAMFNKQLIKSHCSDKLAIIFDPSFIRKSGKHTPGLGYFYSGCAGKIKWGLEIGSLAIADLDNRTAMHFIAQQTTDTNTRDENGLLLEYANQIIAHAKQLLELSKVVVVDAYFAKRPFIDAVLAVKFDIVTRLRNDAHVKYQYIGVRKQGRGRPKVMGEKINFKKISTDHMKLFYENDDKTVKHYHGKAFVKSLKRWCSLVIIHTHKDGKLTSAHAYISTNVEMTGEQLWEYYHNRFQIEFTFRDAKGFLGLEHSQSRNKEAIGFHLNLTLTVLNILKAVHWLPIPKSIRPAFSIADIKTQHINELMVNKFITMFGIDPNTNENKIKIKMLQDFGKIAA